MDIVNLLVTLVSGAIGGNAAGAAVSQDKSLGGLGNTIAGLVGGPIGAYIATAVGLLAQAGVLGPDGMPQSNFDLTHFLGNVASSGVGGALLTFIVGWLKSKI